MAGKDKEKEPIEDRDFMHRLRNEQRDLVMGELKKEQLEVAGRIKEEEKKYEESKGALETTVAKKRFNKLFLVVGVVVFILLMCYLYQQGFFDKMLGLVSPE